MTTSSQLRIRVLPNTSARLKKIPPRLRAKVVSLLIESIINKIDLTELLSLRKDLVSLGVLLNQSLRTSWGQSVDGQAASALVTKLNKFLQ
jgi:hypothetical protein